MDTNEEKVIADYRFLNSLQLMRTLKLAAETAAQRGPSQNRKKVRIQKAVKGRKIEARKMKIEFHFSVSNFLPLFSSPFFAPLRLCERTFGKD